MKALFLLILCTCFTDGLYRFPLWQKLGNDPNNYETLYFSTYRDNFDPTLGPMFQVKYLLNSTYFKKGGPLFFYTGNEGTIEDFAANSGIMFDIAPQFNALIVFCEHRYYGASQPFGADSLKTAENAKYLTVEQTLEDFARLIRKLKQDYAFEKTIAFGGSYGGMLSAWFRQKYPHVVDGAWAASAPVAHFRNSHVKLGDYDKIVSRTMKRFGCNDLAVTGAFKDLDKLGYPELNRIFETDANFQLNSPDDVDSLRSYLKDQFGLLAMVNYPYGANFMADLGAWPMKTACTNFTKVFKSATDGATALKQAAIDLLGQSTPICVLPTCPNQPDSWTWQTCTRMSIDICSQGPPNDYFYLECSVNGTNNVRSYEKFATDNCVPLTDATSGVTDYNTSMIDFDFVQKHYGFDLPGASRLILTQGYLDPWSAGGAKIDKTTAQNNDIFTFEIDGSGHHLDLRQPNSCDPAPITAARKKIVKILKCWTSATKQAGCDIRAIGTTLPKWNGPELRNDCKYLYKQYPWNNPNGGSNPQATTAGSNSLRGVGLLIGFLTVFFAWTC